jgi:Copper transport outer membrane protein, MctB
MINFRFHLVSLVAVFLALTVGIVVGATIVNHAVVTELNDRIDRVEKNADTQKSQNKSLSASANQLESVLSTAAPYVVEGRLTAVPVVVVAEQGVDRSAVRSVVTLMQDAGAQAPAIVWLESKWRLDQPAERTALATIMGADATDPNLRAEAINALAHRLGTATSTTPTRTVDLLSALTTAGFVSIESVGKAGSSDLSTFPTAGARVSIVGGEASTLAANPLVTPLASALSAIDVPTVAAEVYHGVNGQPARATVVAPIRKSDSLRKLVSTVDDVDLLQGQVAVVLATADAGESKIGQYGYGSGAGAPLPSWSGP